VIAAAELAGFVAAHAVWILSDGDMMPVVAYTTATGARHMDTFAGEPREMTTRAFQRLAANPMNAVDAVVAYVEKHETGATAIFVVPYAYAMPKAGVVLIIPFKRDGSMLLAEKGRLMRCEGIDRTDVMRAFAKGVASHEKGAAAWKSAMPH
jgi:hypothetical protein